MQEVFKNSFFVRRCEHRMKRFGYDFLNGGLIPSDIANLLAAVSLRKTSAGFSSRKSTSIFEQQVFRSALNRIRAKKHIESPFGHDGRGWL